MTEVEERIKHAEIRLEREKKLEQSQDAAQEESLLLKSRKLDFEESEKDKKACLLLKKWKH